MPLVNGVESEVAAPDAEIEEVAAASSPADESNTPDATGPKSMLEAVQAAIAPETTEGEDPKAADSSTAKEGEKDTGAPKEDAAEEEPPFHKHPRWQEVQQKKRELETRVAELEPVVAEFEAFRGEVRKAGMSADEVNTLFEIGKLMKTNPAEAWTKLQPYVVALQGFTGDVLPEDLAAKVEAGTVDAETAKEIARLRATSAHAEQSQAEAQQRSAADQQEQARRDAVNFGNSCSAAVTAEAQTWAKTDPDYPKKATLIKDRVAVLLKEKGDGIRTTEDAVALAREAKADVEKTLGLIVPKRPAVRTVTGGSSAKTNAQPKTMLDAMRIAAAGTG